MKKITKKSVIESIKSTLQTDNEAVERGIMVLAARQTEDELESKETKHRNKRGFSSSNAVHGTNFAQILVAGGRLDDAQMERARQICTFHAKQLADVELARVVTNDDVTVEVAVVAPETTQTDAVWAEEIEVAVEA